MAQKQPAVFNHLALYVVDLNKSVSFYQTVLGLDTIPEPFNDGKHAWFKIGQGTSLHLIEGAGRPEAYSRHTHICFSVQSVDEFVKVLQQKSIAYEDRAGKTNAITQRVDGVKQLYFKDPDGYWIEINDDMH